MTRPSDTRRSGSTDLRDTYRAYLVRLWRDTAESPWRVSAQCAETGVVIRFASLQALYAFLNNQTSNEEEDERQP